MTRYTRIVPPNVSRENGNAINVAIEWNNFLLILFHLGLYPERTSVGRPNVLSEIVRVVVQ